MVLTIVYSCRIRISISNKKLCILRCTIFFRFTSLLRATFFFFVPRFYCFCVPMPFFPSSCFLCLSMFCFPRTPPPSPPFSLPLRFPFPISTSHFPNPAPHSPLAKHPYHAKKKSTTYQLIIPRYPTHLDTQCFGKYPKLTPHTHQPTPHPSLTQISISI